MKEAIYRRNIKALKEIQPELVSIINDVDLDSQDRCIVFDGMNGCKVLKVKKKDGNYILYNSFYDPYKEAKEITSHIDYNINRSLIIAIGVGMGYHLQEILSNLNEKSILLVFEKDELMLKNLFTYVDLSKFISEKKIFFVLTKDNKEDIAQKVYFWLGKLLINILSIQIQILPIFDIDYIRYCKKISKCITDVKSTYIFTMGNDIDDTIMGIDNRIMNLPHVIKNPGLTQFLEKYGDVYKGKPAIIIASGPSLDKNIHLLKKAEGKALLLACDGSMESLKKHNIVPDAVSSVERIMLTYEAFYKNREMPADTVLIAPAVVRPEIFKTFKTKTLSMFKTEPIAEWFNKMVYNKGSVWSGVSVAHQLMGFAIAVGADPIILVGQDLAYSPDGVSHTSEAAVKEKVDLSKVNLYVKDAEGNDIPTTFVWKQFKEVFEMAIREYGINCIDATEGGAYIEGTKTMTLEEVIKKYCTNEIPRLRTLVDTLEVDKEFVDKALKNSLKSLIKLAKRFYILKKRCEKSKVLNQKAKDLLNRGVTTDEELNEIYDALDYTEYKIVKRIIKQPGIKMFFQYVIMSAIDKVNKLGTEITFEVLSENLDIHKELLDVVDFYSKRMLNVLNIRFDLVKKEAINTINDEEIKNIIFPEWLEKN